MIRVRMCCLRLLILWFLVMWMGCSVIFMMLVLVVVFLCLLAIVKACVVRVSVKVFRAVLPRFRLRGA